MAENSSAMFQCTGCGKRFRWKPELAGRAVKCPCGTVMTAPAESPSPDEPLYEIADTPAPAPPSAKTAKPAIAPRASSAPAQPVLGYQTKRAASAASSLGDDYFPNKLKDFQMPLVLLCVGIVIECLDALSTSRSTPRGAMVGAMGGILAVGAGLVISTALMLLAVFIAAKFRGIQLGRFWPAVLKLSAISVAPSAAMTLLHVFLRFIPFGGIVTWILGFVFYFALIGVFFDLEESDTWYVVIVVFLTKLTVALLIIAGVMTFLR